MDDSTEIPDLPTDIETSSICSDSTSRTKGSETNASSIVLVKKKHHVWIMAIFWNCSW